MKAKVRFEYIFAGEKEVELVFNHSRRNNSERFAGDAHFSEDGSGSLIWFADGNMAEAFTTEELAISFLNGFSKLVDNLTGLKKLAPSKVSCSGN